MAFLLFIWLIVVILAVIYSVSDLRYKLFTALVLN